MFGKQCCYHHSAAFRPYFGIGRASAALPHRVVGEYPLARLPNFPASRPPLRNQLDSGDDEGTACNASYQLDRASSGVPGRRNQ